MGEGRDRGEGRKGESEGREGGRGEGRERRINKLSRNNIDIILALN